MRLPVSQCSVLLKLIYLDERPPEIMSDEELITSTARERSAI